MSRQSKKTGKVPVRLQTQFSLQWAEAAVFPFVISWSVMPPRSSKPDAINIVRAMSDYISALRAICFDYDAGVEFVTDGRQKIQFVSSGQVLIERPDKFRVSRSAGYADVDFQVETLPKSPDQLSRDLEGKFSLELPGAVLFADDAFEELMGDVIDARYIGRVSIDGVQCEHLAFRNKSVDWQLWVQAGPWPIPRRYVVTSKMIDEAPQYTLHIKEWKTGLRARAEGFAFRAPKEAKIDVMA